MAKEIADRRKKLLYKLEKGQKKETEKVDASKAEKFKSMVMLDSISGRTPNTFRRA